MDMTPTIVPKSDQLNADDLLCGPITIRITSVSIRPGTEQPISVFYDGDEGKPWKPCKSMARVMVSAWGADASKYTGRSLTLYCDPKVKWGGMEVGGIRISHMSDIDSSITMALTVTRANKKPFTVKPIVGGAPKAAAASQVGLNDSAPSNTQGNTKAHPATTGENPVSTAAAPTITADEALKLEERCTDNSIPPAKVKKFFGVTLFGQMTSEQLAAAHAMIDETLAKRKAA